MIVPFIVLVAGFALLVFGADRFVSGASSLAKKFGIPSVIVGLTVVAFGTSAPELAVSVTASLNHANEIALGNVLGSNIFNLLMVAGGSAIIAPLVVHKDVLNRDWIATIISTVALLGLMLLDGDVSRLDAIILLVGFFTIITIQVRSAKKNKLVEDDDGKQEKLFKLLFNIVIGLACIILGGQFAVNGATEIARIFGISETVIGLTVVALGTSLPELVTSLIATKKGENDIAIGNVIGSNLFNVLLILGVSCVIRPITVQVTAIYDTLILLVVTVAMFILAKKNKLTRPFGILCVLSYIAYTAWLIVR